jgi:hypothetical protein
MRACTLALEVRNDADPHAPARPTVQVLHLPRREPHGPRPPRQVRSVAVAEIEGLVLGEARRLLSSPELVARTTTAVRREGEPATT